MNNWLNGTSQYPVLSWRAWKITVARRWFISWETISNCFNLKLCGIQAESTKTQPVKPAANLLLSEEIFQCRPKELCMLSSCALKWGLGVVGAMGAKHLFTLNQGSLITTNCNGQGTRSPWGPATCPGFVPPLGGSGCSPESIPARSQSLDHAPCSCTLWEEEKLVPKGCCRATQPPHV